MNGSSDWAISAGGAAELRLVLERHAKQPADHRDRQRVGEVGDDVEVTGLGDRVEQGVDQRRDVGLQCLDDLRHERLADQLAQPRVVRRVEEEETRLDRAA